MVHETSLCKGRLGIVLPFAGAYECGAAYTQVS